MRRRRRIWVGVRVVSGGDVQWKLGFDVLYFRN